MENTATVRPTGEPIRLKHRVPWGSGMVSLGQEATVKYRRVLCAMSTNFILWKGPGYKTLPLILRLTVSETINHQGAPNTKPQILNLRMFSQTYLVVAVISEFFFELMKCSLMSHQDKLRRKKHQRMATATVS